MEVSKWQQMAEEKSAVDEQTLELYQTFRMNKISKDFGKLSEEELFKPITERLDKSAEVEMPAPQEEFG